MVSDDVTISPERAIENLLYRYAERIDLGDFDGVADLFAHGRIASGDDAATFEGRDAVRAMYEASTRIHPDTGTPRTKHVTTNAIVELTGDSAGTARSYFTVLQTTDSLALQPIITGRYHDTFHLVDGAWWFDTRTMLIDQTGDLSQHLLFDLS